MNYSASVSDFFRSPNWMMNLLLGGVCVLIPIVGPMVESSDEPAQNLCRSAKNRSQGKSRSFRPAGPRYLERGLWPFLVAFVVGIAFSIVIVPLTWVLMIPVMLVGGLSSSGGANAGNCLGFLVMMLMILVVAVIVFAMMLALVPLKIRASLTQDFAQSFDIGFVRKFLALTCKEVVLSSLFVMAIGTLFGCLGIIVFCVGAYFAMVLVYFSWTHLHKQLYKLYLSRGGEPVPLSPKLYPAQGARESSV